MHPNQWADFWGTDRDVSLTGLRAQGFSFGQIGEIMGISRNAVAGRVRRLRISRENQAMTDKPPIWTEPLELICDGTPLVFECPTKPTDEDGDYILMREDGLPFTGKQLPFGSASYLIVNSDGRDWLGRGPVLVRNRVQMDAREWDDGNGVVYRTLGEKIREDLSDADFQEPVAPSGRRIEFISNTFKDVSFVVDGVQYGRGDAGALFIVDTRNKDAIQIIMAGCKVTPRWQIDKTEATLLGLMAKLRRIFKGEAA